MDLSKQNIEKSSLNPSLNILISKSNLKEKPIEDAKESEEKEKEEILHPHLKINLDCR